MLLPVGGGVMDIRFERLIQHMGEDKGIQIREKKKKNLKRFLKKFPGPSIYCSFPLRVVLYIVCSESC